MKSSIYYWCAHLQKGSTKGVKKVVKMYHFFLPVFEKWLKKLFAMKYILTTFLTPFVDEHANCRL